MLPSGPQVLAHELSKRFGSIENKAAQPINLAHRCHWTDTHTHISLSLWWHWSASPASSRVELRGIYLSALSDESIAADLIAEGELKTHECTHKHTAQSLALIRNCDVWLCVWDLIWGRSQHGPSWLSACRSPSANHSRTSFIHIMWWLSDREESEEHLNASFLRLDNHAPNPHLCKKKKKCSFSSAARRPVDI